jgi:hypothetical protein
MGAVLLGMGIVGCSEQGERLNAPPQGTTDRPSKLQQSFATMSDNAAQLDSSIVDMHFEPHAAELSGTGVWRLTRLGEVLMSTGGIIRYQTSLRDEDLVNARLQSVRDFLAASGFDTDRIKVEAGMARNGGGYADQAIEARNAALTDEADSGTAATAGPMTGPQ